MSDRLEDLTDELFVPLFVQARQEALKEADNLGPRGGIVTSTPTKVKHLVKEAETALQFYIDSKIIEARIESVQGLYQSYLNDEFFDAEDFELILDGLKAELKALNHRKESNLEK